PRLTGFAQAGTTVQLLTTSGVVLGTSATAGDGSYTLSPSAPLADGSYTLTVRAIDVAGNIGANSGSLSLTIDTQAPPAPTGPTLLAADDSGAKGDGITNVRQPHLTGTAAPGATVQLLSAGVAIGTATAGADGSYTVQPSAALGDGAYSLQTRAVDAVGNA